MSTVFHAIAGRMQLQRCCTFVAVAELHTSMPLYVTGVAGAELLTDTPVQERMMHGLRG